MITATSVAALEYTFDTPHEVVVNEEFEVHIAAQATEVHDVKIFAYYGSMSSYVSQIFDGAQWRNPHQYIQGAFPAQTTFRIKIIDFQGTTEICARLRLSGSSATPTPVCNSIRVTASSSSGADPEPEPEPDPEPEPTPAPVNNSSQSTNTVQNQTTQTPTSQTTNTTPAPVSTTSTNTQSGGQGASGKSSSGTGTRTTTLSSSSGAGKTTTLSDTETPEKPRTISLGSKSSKEDTDKAYLSKEEKTRWWIFYSFAGLCVALLAFLFLKKI